MSEESKTPDSSFEPIDTGGKPLSVFDQIKDIARQAFAGKKAEDLLSAKHKLKREDLLARKIHTVGNISLPIPNIVAYGLIGKLSADDVAGFIQESVFILFNQCDEDTLFISGIERKKAIAKLAKKIPASDLPAYYICLREMLAELEKKTANYSKTMSEAAQSLISRASLSPFPKSSQDPSDTSNLN